MLYLDRSEMRVPRWYRSEMAQQQRRNLVGFFSQGPESMVQTRLPDPIVDYREEEASDLALLQQDVGEAFNSKCAFCESRLDAAPHIHLFRPWQNASPADDVNISHLYYTWLAHAWDNHFPICEGCKPEDPDYFPVKGRRMRIPDLSEVEDYYTQGDGIWPLSRFEEKALLIDPCSNYRLWEHFAFGPDGHVDGISEAGRETIEHFKLNRPDLVERRAADFGKAISRLRRELANDGFFYKIVEENAEYPGGIKILVREIIRRALDQKSSPISVSKAFDRLKKYPDRLQRIDRAVRVLSGGDDRVKTRSARKPSRPPTAKDLPRSISISAFKSVEQLTIELPPAPKTEQEKAPSLLLLGENAAGKSTILEAFTLAMISPKAQRMLRPEGQPLHPNKLVLNPEYMGADDGVDGAQQPQQAEITVTFADGATRSLTILSGDPSVAGFSVEGEAPKILVFAYGAFRHYLSGARQNTEQRYVRSLFETEWLLSNPEQWLLGLDEADFNMVARALREVFAIDGEFDVLKREKWKPTDEDETVFVVSKSNAGPEAAEIRTPLNIVSSGFRTILAMLCDIMQGLIDPKVNPHVTSLENARGLVLIDEIEAHLHPRWKVKIMRGLRRALPNVVFIAASHDPLCLRGMHAGEVMVVERSQERSPLGLPITTQATVDLPDNQNWTIQQLLTADFFKLHSTEARGAELRRAEAEDLLARGETAETSSVVRAYLKEIGDSLPIGDSDVHRVVNEAIAKFLQERRQATLKDMHGLRDDLLENILDALRGA